MKHGSEGKRGLIDWSNVKQYSLTGRKDEFGMVNDSTFLRQIMSMCHKVINEEGVLQHIAKTLGVKVLLTPKCDAELAGEGVEYVWAWSHHGKDNFKASIWYCLSEEVITKVRIRRFARQAWQYSMAYHAINASQVYHESQHDCMTHGPVGLTRLINDFKTHHSAFDCDFKFIMEV